VCSRCALIKAAPLSFLSDISGAEIPANVANYSSKGAIVASNILRDRAKGKEGKEERERYVRAPEIMQRTILFAAGKNYTYLF